MIKSTCSFFLCIPTFRQSEVTNIARSWADSGFFCLKKSSAESVCSRIGVFASRIKNFAILSISVTSLIRSWTSWVRRSDLRWKSVSLIRVYFATMALVVPPTPLNCHRRGAQNDVNARYFLHALLPAQTTRRQRSALSRELFSCPS